MQYNGSIPFCQTQKKSFMQKIKIGIDKYLSHPYNKAGSN